MNKYVTILRRALTKSYSKGMGKKDVIDAKVLLSARRILIVRPNHRLGNQLLISPIIQEVAQRFPKSKIELFTKGFLAPILYKNYPNVDKYYLLPKKHFRHLLTYFSVWLRVAGHHYDLVINTVPSSSSGTLATRLTCSKNKLYLKEDTVYSSYPDFKHIAKEPVYYLRSVLSKVGLKMAEKSVPTINLLLNEEELKKGKSVLNSLVDGTKPTICIYTFATGLKCFAKNWWKNFYQQLSAKYPDYNILEVLPKEHVSSVDFQCTSYYSLDLREISAVMANTRIFIGTDSGMMHLASASGIPVVGLFNITDEKIYGPYGNHSFSINVVNPEENDRLLVMVDEVLNGMKKYS
ncbi:MAG: glycosyltransferase family 9 protein [Bacteroidaceae bacterium]